MSEDKNTENNYSYYNLEINSQHKKINCNAKTIIGEA